jgi:hypothetical protein
MKYVKLFEQYLDELHVDAVSEDYNYKSSPDKFLREEEQKPVCKAIFDAFASAKLPSVIANKSSLSSFEDAYRPILDKVQKIMEDARASNADRISMFAKKAKYTIKFGYTGRYISIYRDDRSLGYTKETGYGLKASGREGQQSGELCTPSDLFQAVCRAYNLDWKNALNMSYDQMTSALDG